MQNKKIKRIFSVVLILCILFLNVDFSLANNLSLEDSIEIYENILLDYEIVGENIRYYNSDLSKKVSDAKENLLYAKGHEKKEDKNYFLTKTNLTFHSAATYIKDRDDETKALTDIIAREVFDEIPISSSYFDKLYVYNSPFELNGASGLYIGRYTVRKNGEINPLEHSIILANDFSSEFFISLQSLNYKKHTIRNTLLHEIGHLIEREEPELYKAFEDMYKNDSDVNEDMWHYKVSEHFAEEFKYFISKQMKSYGYQPTKPRTHLKRYKETEDLFKNYLKFV